MREAQEKNNKQHYDLLCTEFLFRNAYKKTIDYKALYEKKIKIRAKARRKESGIINLHDLIECIQKNSFQEIKSLIENKTPREIEDFLILSSTRYEPDGKLMNPVSWANLLGRQEILNDFYQRRWKVKQDERSKKISIGKSQLFWALICHQEKESLNLINNEENVKELEKGFYDAALYGASNAIIDRLIEKLREKTKGNFQSMIDAALCGAAENGHLKIVEKLISLNANINAKHEGKSPLWLASQFGHLKVVKKLLENGADIEQKDEIELKKSSHSNIKPNSVESKKEITEKKDSPKPIKKQEDPGLVRINKILEEILSDDKQEIKIEKKIEKKVSDNKEIKENRTPLFIAAAFGQIDIVEQLFENKAKLDSKDINDYTPLMIAVKNCHEETVEYLIKQEAINEKGSIDLADREGETSLFYAVRNNDIPMINLLCKNGANIQQKNNKKQTVSQVAQSLELESIEKTKLRDHLTLWETKINCNNMGIGEMIKTLLEKVLQAENNDINLDSKNKSFSRIRSPSLSRNPLSKLKKFLLNKNNLEEIKGKFFKDKYKSVIFEAKYNFILEHVLNIQKEEKQEEEKPRERKSSVSKARDALFGKKKAELSISDPIFVPRTDHK